MSEVTHPNPVSSVFCCICLPEAWVLSYLRGELSVPPQCWLVSTTAARA